MIFKIALTCFTFIDGRVVDNTFNFIDGLDVTSLVPHYRSQLRRLIDDLAVNKEFNRSESESLDQTVTWDYESKKSDENKLIILEEGVVESKDATEQSGSLAANESVCSSGVGMFEVVKDGSHDKQPGSKGMEEGANPMEMVSKSDMGERRSTSVVKIGPVVFDEEEDIMSILKEMNETRALKRR
ncbi:hypothetical protein PIB30_063267 [Stylosanthes scabra]|uniref:Uncharacterized protein n=1 Tax=Stylosanthes scabra TaxID=79078 RepID=A0ABU6TNQ9_9FABA|nr:hypothetical protein [Stylosanthes scabra]